MPNEELPSYPVHDTCCKPEPQEHRQEHEYLRVSNEQGVNCNNLSQVACVCPKDAYPDKAKNTFEKPVRDPHDHGACNRPGKPYEEGGGQERP